MQASPDTIWAVPVYLPYLQPELTDEAVLAAEAAIGHKLPEEYLNLLRKQNGGYLRFSLPELVHNIIAGIGPNFPSLTAFDWTEHQEFVSYPLQGLVPFDGDGHWHLCLDYRESSSVPSITFADIECDRETRVADSFAEYLSLLRISVDDEYVLEAVSNLEQMKGQLEQQLGASFEPPDCWAHGYPTHRAALGAKQDPQWLWISPNTVARGFARSNEPRYHELRDLMPGFGERFLGLPRESYLLSATDGAIKRVLDACERIGLKIRPLRAYVGGDSDS